MLSSPCLTCLKSDTWQSGPQWARPLASQKTAWKFLKHTLLVPAQDVAVLSYFRLLQSLCWEFSSRQTNKAAAGLPDSCGHL